MTLNSTEKSLCRGGVADILYLYLLQLEERREDVLARRARLYDALALFTVIVVITLDQWTKALVVQYLSPPESRAAIPLIGNYLSLYYIQNKGAAFGMFANNVVLAVLIGAAICVVAYLYIRMLNSGPLAYKVIFGMIIGGAAGNLIDRALRSGNVVDFIWFRIPEIGYKFAIFNLADASISVGVFLLFILMLFGGLRKVDATRDAHNVKKTVPPSPQSGPLRSTEQDA